MEDEKKVLTARLPEKKARVFGAIARLKGTSASVAIEQLIDRYIEENKGVLSDRTLEEILDTTPVGIDEGAAPGKND